MRFLFFITITFLLLSSLSACLPDIEKITKTEAQNKVIVENGVGIEIIFSEEGRMKVKLLAEKAKRYLEKEPYMEFTDGLELYVYDSEMNVDSKLTSNYGLAYENQDEMTAKDDVIVINRDGDQLNTEELIWNKKEKKIYSNQFVKITTEEEIIYGEGMEANENFTDYVIKKITGTIKIKADEDDENL